MIAGNFFKRILFLKKTMALLEGNLNTFWGLDMGLIRTLLEMPRPTTCTDSPDYRPL
jgi:hypothetical protein